VVRSEDELQQFLKSPGFDYRATAVLEEDPGIPFPALPVTPTWHATITEYRNNSIALDAETSEGGLLVLSEIFYPGWKAFVDGTETAIYRTDYNLRGVYLPAGSHHLVVRFEPESFERGRMITLLTLMICVGGIVVSKARSRRALPVRLS
jgi:hypothetical protein